jgi:hypothetical protein
MGRAEEFKFPEGKIHYLYLLMSGGYIFPCGIIPQTQPWWR